MPIKILMPALSPTMTEGNITKWTKKPGDIVSAGEVMLEIETDKATMEVEAVDEGILAKVLAPAGSSAVRVNSPIAVLSLEGETEEEIEAFVSRLNSHPEASGSHPELSNSHPELDSGSHERNVTAHKILKQVQDDGVGLQDDYHKKTFASPLAKRIAKANNISLEHVTGSGPRGRVIKADLLAFMNRSGQNSAALARNPQSYQQVPNNNMRKIIAKRLLESKQTVPHFYLEIECMMDNLLEARGQINANLKNDTETKISVNDLIIMASAKALQEVPLVNASWTEDAILMYNNIDISVAVAIDDGLITPIIKNADQKDIKQISTEMKSLIKRAKENSLAPEEFQGGGFTISNLSMYGIKNFSAIINPPQSCILAVGASLKRPVVINDKLEIRTMMGVTLSCDHRVVDGVVGARFLAAFKKYMEAPVLMFV